MIAFKVGRWGSEPARWTVTLYDGPKIYIGRYRTGEDALKAVKDALDYGFFLGYGG